MAAFKLQCHFQPESADMESSAYLNAFFGGALIGFAALLMLLFNGKILGISGIAGGLFQRSRESKAWRYLFFLGLFGGGAVLFVLQPEKFANSLSRSPGALVLAGLLVGYGTRLGSGCTSGHGVCGVSRLSPRSLMATLTFIAFGALTVFVINRCFGGRI